LALCSFLLDLLVSLLSVLLGIFFSLTHTLSISFSLTHTLSISFFLFMPHADSDKMGEPIVNGEKVHSQFLDVCSYPAPCPV
jgi:hypothetical protein